MIIILQLIIYYFYNKSNIFKMLFIRNICNYNKKFLQELFDINFLLVNNIFQEFIYDCKRN